MAGRKNVNIEICKEICTTPCEEINSEKGSIGCSQYGEDCCFVCWLNGDAHSCWKDYITNGEKFRHRLFKFIVMRNKYGK